MNPFRMLQGITIVAILVGSVLLTPTRRVAAEEPSPVILEAYRSDPEVVKAMNRFVERGYIAQSPRSVGFSSSCGVAGCGYSVLIVHSFEFDGTNPQSRSILALVHSGPLDNAPRVGLMELKPAPPEFPVGEKIPASPPELQVGEKIPAPPPELRVKEKIPAPGP